MVWISGSWSGSQVHGLDLRVMDLRVMDIRLRTMDIRLRTMDIRLRTMGWALAIPMCTGGYYPSPVHRYTDIPGYTVLNVPGMTHTAQGGPAQRLAHSVKTAISGYPIYRRACFCVRYPRALTLSARSSAPRTHVVLRCNPYRPQLLINLRLMMSRWTD